MSFNISIIDNIGTIEIGSFEESFEVLNTYFSKEEYLEQWENALSEIISGKKNTTTLMTWWFPNRIKANLKAWVLYRDGEKVFVQDKIYVPDEHVFSKDENGVVVENKSRQIINDEGDKISEWETSISDLKVYLNKIKKR